jgi:hypothetical protein
VHQLTIDHDSQSVTITAHPDFDTAHRALLKYVVGADYYLRPVHTTAAHSSHQLLHLADPDDPTPTRHPHITGSATIRQLPDTELPVSAPISRPATRNASSPTTPAPGYTDTDPGCRHPAVLTMAHGEARRHLRAGTLLPEAARLAGVEDCASPEQAALQALRHNAISSASNPDDPATIADAVQQLPPAVTGDHQAAALVCYYALIRWGVKTP